MRIEIDTAKDSVEDIQKAINLLQSLHRTPMQNLNNSLTNSNLTAPENTTAFTSMFSSMNKNHESTLEKQPKIETY